jgi:hypothetical protein
MKRGHLGWDRLIDALSVYRAFEQVEDKRHKRGVRYSVALMLTLIPAWENWQG